MQHILLKADTLEQGDWVKVLIGCLILVVVVVLGLLVVTWVKKRMQAVDEPVPAGFTLSDLRQLHKAGQITDEEFERAKAKTVERYKDKEKAKEAAGPEHPGGKSLRPDRRLDHPDEGEDLLT